jgi:hypothetical protein
MYFGVSSKLLCILPTNCICEFYVIIILNITYSFLKQQKIWLVLVKVTVLYS